MKRRNRPHRRRARRQVAAANLLRHLEHGWVTDDDRDRIKRELAVLRERGIA